MLDGGDRLVARQHAGDGEEAGLQDGIDARAEAEVLRHLAGVDDVELQLAVDDAFLDRQRQVVPHRVRPVGRVEQEGGALPRRAQHVQPFQEVELVAGDEIGMADEIGGADRCRAEAQMGDRLGARLVRIVDEIALGVAAFRLGQNFHAVLVGTHRAVGAQPVEHGARDALRLDVEIAVVVEAQMRHVVVDADGEAVLRRLGGQFVEHRLGHAGVEFLRRQAVAPADHARHGAFAVAGGGRQGGDHILVERLAGAAGLLATVEHGDRRHACRQRGEKMLDREGAVEQDLQRADLLALGGQCQRRLAHHLGARAHGDDDALRLRVPVVTEEPVLAAAELGELVHLRLHDAGGGGIERVRRLARLEEGVRIVRRAADHRMRGGERPFAMRPDQGLVDHRPQRLVGEQRQAVDLVRGAETVHEMDDRHAGFQRRRLRHRRQVVRFLHRGRRQHGIAGRARRHHVLVVAEDRQRLGGQRARRHVHHRGRQLAGDLEHVGQHQHQALRRREGRRHRAALQRAVQRTGRTALGLHLLHDRNRAEDVGDALGRPLIGELGHRRRGRDRVDRTHLVQPVGDMCDGRVAIHRDSGVSHFPVSPGLRRAF